MPAGRPTKYKPDYAGQAAKLCRLGATDADLADFFCVAISSIALWKTRHRDFSDALNLGKDEADKRVEQSLYHRAVGYTHDSVKIFNVNGVPLEVPFKEHIPPDTTACIFWLKNRKPAEWRDRVHQEVSGAVELVQLWGCDGK